MRLAAGVMLSLPVQALAAPPVSADNGWPPGVEQAVGALARALRGHDYAAVEDRLAPAFRYAGHRGALARTIMKQVVAGYPDGLSEAEARTLQERLLRFMETERPWLDASLDLPAFAAALDVPANHVSQVLNGSEQESFYDFVNGYRVAAATQRLAADSEGQAGILDIAFGCGFRSKATFNRIFKQHTGVTPTQYRASR